MPTTSLALGAHDVIAYDREDFARTPARFDVVLDLIGGDVHARSYAVLKKGGHMVCLIAAPFVNRAEDFGVRVTTARIHDRRPALEAVAALAAQNVLRPQICEQLPLADAEPSAPPDGGATVSGHAWPHRAASSAALRNTLSCK